MSEKKNSIYKVKWGFKEGEQNPIVAVMEARAKIVATGLASGIEECPVCKGKLHWSRAIGYNGHVHAKCETPDCLAWTE